MQQPLLIAEMATFARVRDDNTAHQTPRPSRVASSPRLALAKAGDTVPVEPPLDELARTLIRDILAKNVAVREGTVMTVGPPPYRRLDCDGRALCYVRVRPRKGAVRVDVSGLWIPSSSERIRFETASGVATLMVRNSCDVADAVQFLVDTVERTRQQRWTKQCVR